MGLMFNGVKDILCLLFAPKVPHQKKMAEIMY